MNNNIVQLKIEQVDGLVADTDEKAQLAATAKRNRFLNCNNEQIVMWLDPKGMLPANHLVWFINDAVNCLDLSEFVAGSGGTDARGRRSYSPAMLVKLISYCRATGRLRRWVRLVQGPVTNTPEPTPFQDRYGMFGEVTQTVGTLASDFQYAGYYYHAPSGLNLTTYRAYNPSLGRWINQ